MISILGFLYVLYPSLIDISDCFVLFLPNTSSVFDVFILLSSDLNGIVDDPLFLAMEEAMSLHYLTDGSNF